LLGLKPHVHFFGGQGIGWALDEDLSRAREAVVGRVHAGTFARSPIIHSAWWPPLLSAGREALRGKSVVCFADNPPAFYLTCPGFEQAAARVDLWIARSREAMDQFRELGLPAAFAPYTVSKDIFCPIPSAERKGVRDRLGIGEGDFVVGNFHRDSLERDVSLPKAQKGPDIFVEVVDRARPSIPSLKVLLAGPRRHWLRGELTRRGIPFLFTGRVLDRDDFDVNVLPREELNRLYAALDCVLISSRWEGGPYAVLESLFAGRPVISTRVGMAADLLEGYLYSSPEEGGGLLASIAATRPDFSPRRDATLASHSPEALGSGLIEAYAGLRGDPEPIGRAAKAVIALGLSRWHRKFRQPLGSHPGVAEIMENVRRKVPGSSRVAGSAIRIAGASGSPS
jgi:glycosyltransferase involved in cell wall biosynthesis